MDPVKYDMRKLANSAHRMKPHWTVSTWAAVASKAIIGGGVSHFQTMRLRSYLLFLPRPPTLDLTMKTALL